MSNLYLPGAAVIISAILLIVYCTKEKLKIKENDIYLGMLICILLDSMCGPPSSHLARVRTCWILRTSW